MGIRLAEENVDPSASRSLALVLGPEAVSHRLARDLAILGFETRLESTLKAPLPSPADPDAIALLRRSIEELRVETGVVDLTIHPGVGPWSSRPELALVAEEIGVTVVGPSARILSLFGNRLNFLGLADQLQIPHLALGFEPLRSLREAMPWVVDLPVVLKSVYSGASQTGTAGLMTVYEDEDLERRFRLWLEQLGLQFGESLFYVERYIEGARRVSLPFARLKGRRSGERTLEFFPVVDSSLQFRGRKVIEICPAAGLGEDLEGQLHDRATRLLDHCSYVGLGVLEFLINGDRAFLIDGLARLDTSFRLWESTAGIRAVEWQLAALDQCSIRGRQHLQEERVRVAARIYAENSLLQLPQPGVAFDVRVPEDGSTEVDLAIGPGTEVGGRSDGLLGIVYGEGASRREALKAVRSVLEQSWISGSLQTNESFLLEVLEHPWVEEGMFHAGFLHEEFIPQVRPPASLWSLFAAVCSGALPLVERGKNTPEGGRAWLVSGRRVDLQGAGPGASSLQWHSGPELFEVAGLRGIQGKIRLPDGALRILPVCAYPVGEGRWQVRIGRWFLPVRCWVGATPLEGRGRSGDRPLYAQVSGRVHAIQYREGASIPAHESLIVIESLGTLVPHAVPLPCSLLEWKVRPEVEVIAGQEIARIRISES